MEKLDEAGWLVERTTTDKPYRKELPQVSTLDLVECSNGTATGS